MPSLDIKFNIDGELIELKDLGKVVKALTKKERNQIDKLKQDIVSIDKQKITAKKFEILGNEKLRQSLDLLISRSLDKKSVLTKMVALPIGIDASEFISYLDVKIQPGVKSETPVTSIQPIQVAKSAKWQSKSFPSRATSVTEAENSTKDFLFSAGSVKLLILNNAISSVQGFDSKFSPVVGNGDGQFKPGRFFINDKPLDLALGDTLSDICEKINKLQVGVKSYVGENEVGQQFKLTMESEKIGSENSILIDDPNLVFSQLGSDNEQCFVQDKQYETLNLDAGDTLDNIAYKINKFEKRTNLRADIMQLSRGQYTLVLKSVLPGVSNKFQIIDDVPLNGSNSGKVFNDVFNDTISVTTGTKASVTEPQDAIAVIDGTEVRSTTNQFEVYNGIDVIVKAVASKPMGFEVKHDINSIFIEVNNLVDRYNLLRQMYLDSISEDKKDIESQLEKNHLISNAMANMDFAFQNLEYYDIGVTRGSLELDTVKDNETVKKEYANMAILDKSKLFATLTDDPKKLIDSLDLSFESSSSNFIEPFFSKKIGINNKPLSTETIDIDLSIDVSKIRVRSRSSIKFSDRANIVDQSSNEKLKPGTFWINGSPVTIKAGMSLEQVVAAINSVSNMSRISAVDNGNYIELRQYNGSFTASDDSSRFEMMNIYDPNCTLQNVFSSLMKTGVFHQDELVDDGTFTVNGVMINVSSDIDKLVKSINDSYAQSGVTAKAVSVGQGSYYIEFNTDRLQDIVIDNSLGGLGDIKLPKIESQQSNNYFFDTSAAVKGSVKVNHKQCGNPIVLRLNGSDIKGGGTLFQLNTNSGGVKIDNLEILFVGDKSDSAEISIRQGLATNLLSQLDTIFKLQSGYKGSTNAILQINNEIDRQKSQLEKTIKVKEDLLKNKEKMLFNKFAKAQAQVDESEVYINMIKEMMKSND
jgi:hypothetical protein